MLRWLRTRTPRRSAALYGLAAVLSWTAVLGLRREDEPRAMPVAATRPTPAVQREPGGVALLPPIAKRPPVRALDADEVPSSIASGVHHDPAVVRVTAVVPTTAGVAFPARFDKPAPVRVAQLMPPVVTESDAESSLMTALEPLPPGDEPPPIVTPAPEPTAPPSLAAETPVAHAPGSPVPPIAAPEPVAPYRLGAFTQEGTITPADVRTLALMNNKEIAVIGRIPDVNEPLVRAELASFDPVFNIALNGGRYNRQTSSEIQSLGVDVPVLKTAFWQPSNGLNQTYVEKLFVTGGKVQAGLGQTYYNYNPAGDFVTVNPAYQASVNILAEQPLFRGRGPAATLAPVRIAQANHDQSVHVFRATVNQILRDAELAYWETYAAFQDFEVRDLAWRQALQTLDRERGRLELGEGSVPDVAQAEEQCAAFHIARTDAENRLIAAQRALRRLLGLPPDDPRPIIPAATPSDAPLELDWAHASAGIHNRPELAAQAAAVEAVQIELARRRNGLLPDVSVQGIYSVTGLDQQFADAWGTAGNFGHNSWTAGVVYKQPLGRRSDRALADRAAAALALETARLAQVEHELLHQLDAAFQNVQAAERMLDLHRRRRAAAAVQLEARRELYLEDRADLRDQLEAEARYASALFDEAVARVNYQRALTEWNFARGDMADGDVVFAP